MDHEPVLISTIAIGLTAAFIGGLIARHIRLPAIVGYIVAGVVIGPFTPGLIADTDIALELAELGVILLMFGVGIQFSIRELLAVRSIAIPGAIIQTVVSGLFGVWLGSALGWSLGGGLVLGLAISIASTVVVLRALTDRNELDTPQGRIAVGWLIVEDLLAGRRPRAPADASPRSWAAGRRGERPRTADRPLIPIVLALAKAVVFAVVMVVVGARLVPWLLLVVAREGSRELFTLAVLAIALGHRLRRLVGLRRVVRARRVPGRAGRRRVGHEPPGGCRCAAAAGRLRRALLRIGRDAAGPGVPAREPAAGPGRRPADRGHEGDHEVRRRGRRRLPDPDRPHRRRRTGPDRRVLVHRRHGRPLARACCRRKASSSSWPERSSRSRSTRCSSRAIDPIEARLRATPGDRQPAASGGPARWGRWTRRPRRACGLHAIVCGYGRVGRMIGPALERRGFRYVVITQQRDEVDRLRARGIPAIFGDAANPEVLRMAQIEHARLLVVATSDPNETRLIVERAQALQPGLDFVVRTHSDAEAAHLRAIERQGPGRPWRARAGRADGPLRPAALRRQRDRGRGDRPGPARPIRGSASPGRARASGPAWWAQLRDRFRRPPAS